MADISTISIGLALLGFVLGAVIVALANQSRMRRLEEAHNAQLRLLRDEDARRTTALEAAQDAQKAAEESAAAAQREVEASQRDVELVRAQQAEDQEAADGLEDRLNAAEARVLTLDAEISSNREEVLRWSAAYATLRDSQARLLTQNRDATTTVQRLETELNERSEVLDALHTRLDSLQNALSLAIQSSATSALLPQAGDVVNGVPATIHSIAQARAEVQALLRQREFELADLRSQLSATRFSVGVLTSAGAELAALLNQDEAERRAFADDGLLLAAKRPVSQTSEAARDESLASLEGIVADWYAEVSPLLPFRTSVLTQFVGQSVAERFSDLSSQSAGEIDASNAVDAFESMALSNQGRALANDFAIDLASNPDHVIHLDASLSPEYMLAVIKAMTTAALQRNASRQNDLINSLTDSQEKMAAVRQRVQRWRADLVAMVAKDPDMAQLLIDAGIPDDGDAIVAALDISIAAWQHDGEGELTDELATGRDADDERSEPNDSGTAKPAASAAGIETASSSLESTRAAAADFSQQQPLSASPSASTAPIASPNTTQPGQTTRGWLRWLRRPGQTA